ncbi:MAG TPA: hypothetical protein VKV39_03545 [Candidatus Sulfotelmatobacter sp.]|nr:hypothetical protein [Candidatus Sulfotelmatobacter sp.]
MNSCSVVSKLTISIAAIVVGLTTYAHAGPPLICHRIEIGQAKSLPLIDWNRQDTAGYVLKNLSRDTLAILDANAPVLVRMETLRRAVIYARHDPQVAKELLTRVMARTTPSEVTGRSEALAWFDAGYLIETYKQWIGRTGPHPAAGMDGYGLVKKAISLRGEDAEMEFAAALITLSGPESAHRDHRRRAIEGAKADPLLSQNLAADFHGQTIAEM